MSQEDQKREEKSDHFEELYRKEMRMSNKMIYEKECYLCKVVSFGLFSGLASFHFYRTRANWRRFPLREKCFNIFAIMFLAGIATLSANAGVQIYKGQNLMLDDVRPGLFRRMMGELSAKQK
jgi:hypothetical protein